ncbi:hypothetical protein Trydic_g13286, partial [Trypoxylus dichotomus]
MEFRTQENEGKINLIAKTQDGLQIWHEKLAHQHFKRVKNVLQKHEIACNSSNEDQFCRACLEGKQHRLQFELSRTRAEKTCEVVHADVCGPMEEASLAGSKYFLLLKDDLSHYRYVYFLKHKAEVILTILDFIKAAENDTGNKARILRSDNGLEFVSGEMEKLLKEHGIRHQRTVAYTPEQNGKAEREMRTLVEAARTLLKAKKLEKRFWAEAVNTAAYVLNRTGTSSVE